MTTPNWLNPQFVAEQMQKNPNSIYICANCLISQDQEERLKALAINNDGLLECDKHGLDIGYSADDGSL